MNQMMNIWSKIIGIMFVYTFHTVLPVQPLQFICTVLINVASELQNEELQPPKLLLIYQLNALPNG